MPDTPGSSPSSEPPQPSAGDSKPNRDRRREGPPPTPFDHPYFLPVLLLGFTLWFGYDGWINTDPDMLEHQTFNRYGFVVLVVLTIWTGIRGLREMRQKKEAESRSEDPGPGSS